MDWLDDFKDKFSHIGEIVNIKRNKFHGSLEINFAGGDAKNCNIKQHALAKKDDN